MSTGKLYLLPNLLAETEWQEVIPQNVRNILVELENIVVEDIRTARRYLRKLGYTNDFSDRNFMELNKHTKEEALMEYLQICLQGKDIGMLSESGLPCIADPGNLLVDYARSMGIKVVPLSGPSSIFLSLMASGFNGQNFAFIGYLPIDKKERLTKISELERLVLSHDQTQIFIETPYRNLQVFEVLLHSCKPSLRLCIASNISASNESIQTKSIQDWRKSKIDINKQNTIFLLYK